MPWTAIPFGDARIEGLNTFFEVEGIPTTILIDGDSFRVLNKELRATVMSDSAGARFPWKPEPVSELEPAFLAHINEVACFLLLLPQGRKAR
jgi:nucleoredoxin